MSDVEQIMPYDEALKIFNANPIINNIVNFKYKDIDYSIEFIEYENIVLIKYNKLFNYYDSWVYINLLKLYTSQYPNLIGFTILYTDELSSESFIGATCWMFSLRYDLITIHDCVYYMIGNSCSNLNIMRKLIKEYHEIKRSATII